MECDFRKSQLNDLEQIMLIENSGFTPAEAATPKAMRERIKNISDTFIVAINDEEILGYVVGPTFNQRYLTDNLYQHAPQNSRFDAYQTVLSLAVKPAFRQHGVGSQLLSRLAQIARQQNRQGITLTCLQRLVPFYELNGYVNEGLSSSQHAGENWYNMVYYLGNRGD
ncbi:GNAT family N-acetyltransferase [Bombilactobacillus bombi]|uniref:GNAT family N-acetyltransferase n=1 Tax=Bombilactobacillus bombi TaxID=1303590 RepID=UPI0015E5D303|nr:GNAT family N-acetyltransferase [Bombilactobacillus bombi]MBA1435144.1 N-acetyltransferase [Bombilactobacillus bombi]